MKRNIVVFALLTIIVVFALGAWVWAAEAKEYHGDIIDGMCMNAHKADLAKFVPQHTKDCVLAPNCRTSGMYLYQSDGTLLKFDEDSSNKIVMFLEKKDSKLQVSVKAEKVGDIYKLISIKNQ